ncbi:adenylate/guanylate cyclase domain-containing protein [Rhizobium sp. P44RR-XXIV]|uniref:adenylate/guanylate cyclase domain-containing protein n=1 Tax=Rhizobium sp. P44RR-XXIV TaxID=1921145 RepID=UPI0032B1B600
MVAGTVFAHRGTVDKFIGDGVMAVFGQPKPQPDDAHRALACAVELAAALDRWRLANIEQGGPPLETGIGLHYGTVIGGVLESGFHDEFTVIGDAVNVAQRLESVAKKLRSPLVISTAMMDQVPGAQYGKRWLQKDNVKLEGRKELIDIAYLSGPTMTPLVSNRHLDGEYPVLKVAAADELTPLDQETGGAQTDSHRSSFQSEPRAPLAGI